jgi:hypothetical protein
MSLTRQRLRFLRRALLLLGLASALALTGSGCVNLKIRLSGQSEPMLVGREEVALVVRIHSEPRGALVKDPVSGESLGVTPLEHRPFSIVFEEWAVGETSEALSKIERPGRDELSHIVTRGGAREEPAPDEMPFVIRYRLELEGYRPAILEHTLVPEHLPRLLKDPLLEFRAELEPL